MHTISENCNLLVFQIVRPIPPSRVHLLSHEVLDAIDFRPLGLVQLANGTDEEVRLDLICRAELCIFTPFGRLDINVPPLRLIVPNSVLNRRVEAHMLVDSILLRNTHQVRKDLFLPGILAGPIAVLLVAQAVQRAPDIAAAARIFVVVPRSPDSGALFNNDEVAAVVASDQVDGGAYPRDPGSDDQHGGVGMVCVADFHFGPWHIARHDCDVCESCVASGLVLGGNGGVLHGIYGQVTWKRGCRDVARLNEMKRRPTLFVCYLGSDQAMKLAWAP